jgi:hypothetical protein
LHIAEILSAAQRVGRSLSDQALLNLMRGVNVACAVPKSEQLQADDAHGTIPGDLDNVALVDV